MNKINLKVKDVMKTNIDIVDGMKTVKDALEEMKHVETKSLIVVLRDENVEWVSLLFLILLVRFWQKIYHPSEPISMKL